MSSTRMTGGQAVVATLAAHHLDFIFGIPGGHSLPIYDALAGQTQIRHVLGRHEQGLGFMADGYARASGGIGVVTVTSGPGVANLGAALGGANTDTSSVLAIASTIPSHLIGKGRGHIHECGETLDLMRPLCRHVARFNTVAEIPELLSELIYKLQNGRPGAVYCEIPADVLGASADVEIPSPRRPIRLQPKPEQVKEAVKLLAQAQRPLIWTGMGAVVSGAQQEVEELAQQLGAVVVTSSLGRGLLPGDHPNVVTLDGALLTEVNEFIAGADVVLAVGTMFKQEDTANWMTKVGQQLVHIDLDPAEIGRSYLPTVGIVADARTALLAILEEMPERKPAESSWVQQGQEAVKKRLAKRRAKSPDDMRALDILRNAVPREGIIVCDRCNLGYWAWRCMPAYAARTFQYPLGYGALGGALPQAIGAKLACPEKPVVCVIGDGGFQFTGTELAVAVQEQVPITIVLCNNRSYGAIQAKQDRDYGRRFGNVLINPDFQLFAAAYGVPALRAENLDSFEEHLHQSVSTNKLSLIELTVDISDP